MAFLNRKTPGVYVTELSAFPASVVGVPTAIPVFVGYTETAVVDGKDVSLQAVAISSLPEYAAIFGGAWRSSYDIVPVAKPAPGMPAAAGDVMIGGVGYVLVPTSPARFFLYDSLRLFYANGGGPCYIVSVGNYTKPGQPKAAVQISGQDLLAGLAVAGRQIGPTMTVIPDAVLLPDIADFQAVAQAMLAQCGLLQDRVALFDVYGAASVTTANLATQLDPVVTAFYGAVGDSSLSYGMAYFPFLQASVVTAAEIDYTDFNPAQYPAGSTSGPTMLQALLAQAADTLYAQGSSRRAGVQGYVDAITTTRPDPASPAAQQAVQTLNQTLLAALPALAQLENSLVGKLNVLPPSGAMAGLYALNDQSRGVWNAPANLAVTAVTAPTVNLNDTQQGPLNVPFNGKAINVIRQFVGRGPVVWGARTLDGNSSDWRYIQVRRTIVYIETSIKAALQPYVFAANDQQTWVAVTAMVSGFLQNLWSQGGLMGAKASEAFSVRCGLGSTMTADDILSGYMVVQVTLQMVHPAEFIELTFKQQMQGT